MGSFRHVAPPQTVMSSSTIKDSSSYSSLWNEDAAPVTFHSLPVKPKSPFQRRQVVTFVILLCVITLSICYFTAWILPSPTSTKPWQLKTNRACTRSILGSARTPMEAMKATGYSLFRQPPRLSLYQSNAYILQFKMCFTGYTCSWQDSWMQPSGCCDQRSTSTSRFSCETCDPSAGCCGVYELCVSCCLKEDNLQLHFQSDRLKQLATKDKEIFKSLSQDPFELCQMVCRTSSRSLDLVDGNTVFRSESLKYCYNSGTSNFATARAQNNGDEQQRTGDQQQTQVVGRSAKAFMRRTTSLISAAVASSSSLMLFSYYLLIAVASLAFFYL